MTESRRRQPGGAEIDEGRYGDFLARIKDDPASKQLWNELKALARGEPAVDDGFSDLQMAEIEALGRKIFGAKNVNRAFTAMAKNNSRGENWYDLLMGYQNQELFEPVVAAIETDGLKWRDRQIAVDLGCGTGLSTARLAAAADLVAGVDKNAALIREAKRRDDYPASTSFYQRRADNLAMFAEGSVDIVVSNGLQVYLDEDEFEGMASELRRVLVPWGRYLFAVYGEKYKQAEQEREKLWMTSAKAMMLNMLAERVTRMGGDEDLSLTREVEILEEKGFGLRIHGDFEEDEFLVFEFLR